MDTLRAMRVFTRVAEEGSFARAARALDLAPAVVTRAVADLEERLGARLIQRTTRRLALTDIGEAYLERARQIVLDVEEAEALASSAAREPRGHVRLLAPPAVAVHQLAKRLPKFHAQYPQVTVEIEAPGPVETIDEAFDVSILALRKPPDGDFVARRLARAEVIACAAPEYLDRRGRPRHPSELAHHDNLVPPIADLLRGLTFHRGRDAADAGESFTVVPALAVLSTMHTDTRYAAALAGLGIAGLPSYVVEDALLEHALERVLPEWHLFSTTLWAALPTRKHVPARTRALVEFLLAEFGGEDRDPWLAAARCESPPRRDVQNV